jgi:hypothetical protein
MQKAAQAERKIGGNDPALASVFFVILAGS